MIRSIVSVIDRSAQWPPWGSIGGHADEMATPPLAGPCQRPTTVAESTGAEF
jgi:hypothetical protein